MLVFGVEYLNNNGCSMDRESIQAAFYFKDSLKGRAKIRFSFLLIITRVKRRFDPFIMS